MKRRSFVSLMGTAALLPGGRVHAGAMIRGEGESQARSAPPMKMHLGTQQGPTTPRMLDYLKRHGVNHICGYPPAQAGDGVWSVEDLKRTRDLCEQHGIALDMIGLPFLTSSHIDRERRGAIMLGKSPERDRDIEQIQKIIAACAGAGIPAFKYNMSLLGVLRTGTTPGRGGSRYSTWRLAEARAEPPLTRAGKVSADMAWERITYFLDRVIPVCNEYKVRAACHPHDPGVPPAGFQGIVRVLGTPAGLRRFLSIQESPYHGLNLCLGTTAEMLQDPRREIHDIIREFGRCKKIFNIHFRNIRGHRDDFQEVFPDEGDMDMLAVARTLHEVGYEFMLMPDHVPTHPDDSQSLQAFAFTYGYISAILEAVAAMS